MAGKLTRSIAAPTAMLTLVSVIAGCGGGDTSTTQEKASIPQEKATFLEQADAICANGNRKLKVANEQAFGNQQANQADVELFVRTKIVPIVQAQVDQIRALAIPSGDQAAVREMLDAAQSDVEKAKREPELLAQNKPVFEDANELASDYGLTACGSTHFF